MTDKATDCDYCHGDIPYGVLCWSIHDYYNEHGEKVVKICCDECYAKRP